MDLKDRFDTAFAAEPEARAPHRPIAERVVAGRRARRRRTSGLAAGSLAALTLVVGLGWSAVDGPPATREAPVTSGTGGATESEPPAGALEVVEGELRDDTVPELRQGRLVVAPGTEVLERIDGIGLDGHPEAVGLRLRMPGDPGERWMMADRQGWTMAEQWLPGRRFVDLSLWVEDAVAVAEERDPLVRQFDVTPAGQLVALTEDVEVLEQLEDPDLGPAYGPGSGTTLVARVVIDGEPWFLAGSVLQPYDPQLLRYQPEVVGPDATTEQVAAYVRDAGEREARHEG